MILPNCNAAVAADTTDESALRSLGIRNFEHVVVAIGENIQASILTTLMLKEIGVKKITVKAQNDYHEKVLTENWSGPSCAPGTGYGEKNRK